MNNWSVTYDEVDDTDIDSGYICKNVSLKDALYDMGNPITGLEPSESNASKARWWTTIDSEINMRTGTSTNMSIHIPENTTSASRSRIARLFQGKHIYDL